MPIAKGSPAPTPEEGDDEAADRQISLGMVFESLDRPMFQELGQVRLDILPPLLPRLLLAVTVRVLAVLFLHHLFQLFQNAVQRRRAR